MIFLTLALVLLVLAFGASGLQDSVGLHELSSHQDQSHSRRAHTEIAYWEARDRAEASRKTLPATAFTTAITDLGDLRRLWDYYPPDYNCPFLRERVGRLGDGGKWVCGLRFLLQTRSCLVYSLGSAGDVSFEEQVLSRTPCEVHTFDPNLSTDAQNSVQASLPNLHFHAVGLGRSSGPIVTMTDRGMHSFEEVMAALGHAWVDVLKVDIEGHEWDMFLGFFDTPDAHLPVTQLLVEFHWPGSAEKVWKVGHSASFHLDLFLFASSQCTLTVQAHRHCRSALLTRVHVPFCNITLTAWASYRVCRV